MKNETKIFILFLYCTFSNFNICFCQLSDSTIKTIFENAIKTIDLEKMNFNYTDSIIVDDFDFKEFKPNTSQKCDNKHYKIFYRENEISKISRYDDFNPNVYEFYIWDYANYKIYIVSTFNKEDPYLVLFNISGFFIYDKKYKWNKFIGIECQVFALLEDEKSNKTIQPYLIKDNIPDTKLIRTIISLDHSLNPICRLNFYNNKLISFSEFKFEMNTFFERMCIYANSEIDLSKLTFIELGYLLSSGEPQDGIALKFGVILNQKYRNSIWADSEWRWGYISSPKDNRN